MSNVTGILQEELMSRLDQKLEVLREEHLLVAEESRINDELGETVAGQVSRLARPHETSKYRLHVEEVGKITSLLLGLSGRLARAENALMGLPDNHAEKKILESKRDKLKEQLDEAKKLKENIDRRSVHVSKILYKYFNEEEYADYDHFINMKAKLIMDSPSTVPCRSSCGATCRGSYAFVGSYPDTSSHLVTCYKQAQLA
ncbi:hypothetical protein PR048_021787 [Dryococelus australis]|uniref:ASD2 domain-containing protein n=1 Tax=Dryococelus australis TaxID=614101 RepID=A0ABQ9GZ62_9NEOP|nr:hypothetical protein PR048_021787 [Dryococelus australis]